MTLMRNEGINHLAGMNLSVVISLKTGSQKKNLDRFQSNNWKWKPWS